SGARVTTPVRASTSPRKSGPRSPPAWGCRRPSEQEKVRWNEAALNGVHGETELLERGETQQDGIPRCPEYDATGNRFPVHGHCGVAHVPLGPPAVGEHERHRPEGLDPDPTEDLSRDHGQSGTRIREGGDLLGPCAGSRIRHGDVDADLAHTAS